MAAAFINTESRWLRTLVAAWVFALSIVAARADDGFNVQPTPASKNEGVNATDLYKMTDESLGSNFGGLIMVFGGCYTADFSKKAADSKVAKSGKPVAVLAATDKNKPTECTPAAEAGAPFLSGVMGGFLDVMTGKMTGTTADAFKQGQAGVEREEQAGALKKKKEVEHSTPTATYFGGGDKMTLVGAGGKKHAIIFMGKPQTVFDWRDFANQYQQLVDAGYTDIQAFFGVGKTAGKKDDNTPLLTKDDFTPGISVQRDADGYGVFKPGFITKFISQQTGKDGKVTDVERPIPFKPATFANLKEAFDSWKANGKTNPNDHYFFSVGTHSTHMAMPRSDKELLADTGANTGAKKAAVSNKSSKSKDGDVGQITPPIKFDIEIGRGGREHRPGNERERERGGLGIGGFRF